MWFSSQREIKCSDNSTRVVFKNPEKAFPFYAKDFKSNVNAALKVAKEIELKLQGQSQSVISGLYAQIDESNRNVQMSLRAAYVTFLTSPCTKDEWLAEQVSLIIAREDHMRNLFYGLEFIKQLVKDKADSQIVNKAVNRLVSTNSTHYNDNVKTEFQKAAGNINKWRGQNE